jgi:hypothetical protein
MREIRQSGSEGGAGYIPVPTPIKNERRDQALGFDAWVRSIVSSSVAFTEWITPGGRWSNCPARRAWECPAADEIAGSG